MFPRPRYPPSHWSSQLARSPRRAAQIGVRPRDWRLGPAADSARRHHRLIPNALSTSRIEVAATGSALRIPPWGGCPENPPHLPRSPLAWVWLQSGLEPQNGCPFELPSNHPKRGLLKKHPPQQVADPVLIAPAGQVYVSNKQGPHAQAKPKGGCLNNIGVDIFISACAFWYLFRAWFQGKPKESRPKMRESPILTYQGSIVSLF